jgi:hypothetical protein
VAILRKRKELGNFWLKDINEDIWKKYMLPAPA